MPKFIVQAKLNKNSVASAKAVLVRRRAKKKGHLRIFDILPMKGKGVAGDLKTWETEETFEADGPGEKVENEHFHLVRVLGYSDKKKLMASLSYLVPNKVV